MNNRDLRRVQALVGHPDFQRFCAEQLNAIGEQVPPGANPAGIVLAHLHAADPEYLYGHFLPNVIQEHERFHGAPPSSSDDAHDWDAELPPGAVVKAWKALPEHSRLRQSASSPESEELARRDLARMGGQPLPGLTAGQTVAAYLHYAGKHSKALASGDRAVYDSLAKRLGGALGDGEGLRWMVDQVKQIHYDDHVLHRLAEKDRAAQAEAAKHRPKPAPQPVYDKKFIPQSAIRPKEKPPDGTRDEVARQVARAKGQWEVPGRRRTEKLRTESNDPLHLAVSMALLKSKGESYDRLRIGPGLLKQGVQELREKGFEPAFASRSNGNSSARHWVEAPPSSVSERSYPSSGTSSGGGYSDSTSSESTGSEGAAQTGSGT